MMIIRIFIVLLLWLSLCGCRESQMNHTSATAGPETVTAKVEPIELANLSLPPVSTFEDSCASCHGPQGSFFGDEFAQLPDAKLRTTVQDMMEGPAFLKPSNADLHAMVAYIGALAAKEPFLCITAFEPPTEGQPGSLEGQATPNAKVSLNDGRSAAAVASEKGAWRLRGIDASWPLILTVQANGKTTTLDLRQSQWSHQTR